MGLRASDEDRERVVDFLRAQQGLGRLTLDELEERSAAAWAAVEVTELDALMADLPHSPAPARAPVARRRAPWLPGWVGFSVRWRAPARPGVVMADLLEDVVPSMVRYGFEITERTPQRIVFTYSRTPYWVIIPGILLFPFGLLAAVFVKSHDRVTVELADRGGGTLLVAHGVAPLSVRKAFAELEDPD
jgi:hypothetical protein